MPDVGAAMVIVGATSYFFPALVMIKLVTFPSVTTAVAAACVPPEGGADIVTVGTDV